MAATLALTIDLSGWTRNISRVRAGIAAIPPTEIGPTGELNVTKAVRSFRRGDKTYPASAAALARAGKLIARGLKAVAGGDAPGSMVNVMERAAKRLVLDVKAQINDSQVMGPPRSAKWIRRKGQNINMVGLTGRFVRSLRARVVR